MVITASAPMTIPAMVPPERVPLEELLVLGSPGVELSGT